MPRCKPLLRSYPFCGPSRSGKRTRSTLIIFPFLAVALAHHFICAPMSKGLPSSRRAERGAKRVLSARARRSAKPRATERVESSETLSSLYGELIGEISDSLEVPLFRETPTVVWENEFPPLLETLSRHVPLCDQSFTSSVDLSDISWFSLSSCVPLALQPCVVGNPDLVKISPRL